jgi:hypothetical protein
MLLNKQFRLAIELDDMRYERKSGGHSNSGNAAERPGPHHDPTLSLMAHGIMEGINGSPRQGEQRAGR